MPSLERDPLTIPGNPEMRDYVNLAIEWKQYIETTVMPIWEKTIDWWDLFLARQTDNRDPVDEQWRSNVFVPMPFTATRTKVAKLTDTVFNQDPIWQTEARRESAQHFDQSKPVERLVQYTYEQNTPIKFAVKTLTSRSVQGTSWFKVVWQRRAHNITLYPTQKDYQRFIGAVQMAQLAGAPPAPDYLREPEKFDEWRRDVNKAQRFDPIPAPPIGGEVESLEYAGPIFQEIPIWHVYVDPFIDELVNQKFIIHRMVKPLSEVLARADDLPPGAEGSKPFYLDAVKASMEGWDGTVLQKDERELAQNLGYSVQENNNPYLEKAVELWEIWSPQEPFKYSIVMNQRNVINKTPGENPLLTTTPNLFAIRNIVVPGHFYGLSDYQEPEELFRELNKFRRLRQDGATLTTLPVFVKQAGLALGDALRKLRPGMVLSVPGAANAVTTLIKHQLPPEAYREPPEMKDEITDATEVPPYMKGEQATVGRVTGTEFSGRQAQSNLKYKVDAGFVEDEMAGVPSVILSFFAQMEGDVRREIAGEPDALIDISKQELIAGLRQRFRFKGTTRSSDPALTTQQLIQAFSQFGDVMTPIERRFGLQLVMELMDIRGWSKVISSEGGTQIQGQADAQGGAATAQAQSAQQGAEMEQEQAPGQLTEQQAQAMQGGASGGAQ